MQMRIDVLSIFPHMFGSPFSESIVKRATDKQLVTINVHDLRDWTTDAHKTVDDRPYGGGPGMVMRVDVIDKALIELKSNIKYQTSKIILLSAKGERYTQQKAQELSKNEHIILICGHYEGIDHRVYEIADEVVSIGDYVLTGGELPAMVLVDSLVRLLPGALGDVTSSVDESHSQPGYVEYPQFTRPEEYKGKKVPEVLLSGDHAKVADWRKKNAVSVKGE